MQGFDSREISAAFVQPARPSRVSSLQVAFPLPTGATIVNQAKVLVSL